MNAKAGHKRIYLDHAASTPVDPRVRDAMKPYWNDVFGNPSALHAEGRAARTVVEESRAVIARALGCSATDVFFTSGGTESNNIAILGSVAANAPIPARCVTSSIEHPSVLNCFKTLEEAGVSVDYIGVDAEGVVDLDELAHVLGEHTTFVSIMFSNNDIGTLQPIQKIAHLVRKKSPDAIFHTDASQAPVFYKLDVHVLGIDLLTIDAQKMYGPKGIGVLYKKEGVEVLSRSYGGKQESGLRPGTENVPGIVGMARAYEIAEEERAEDVQKITELRDYFIMQLSERIPGVVLNGSVEDRMPNNVNMSFEGAEGEFLVLQLDEAGIACSARSACFGSGNDGSPVVAAIDPDRSKSAVRFSLGKNTTREEIGYVLSVLEEKIGK